MRHIIEGIVSKPTNLPKCALSIPLGPEVLYNLDAAPLLCTELRLYMPQQEQPALPPRDIVMHNAPITQDSPSSQRSQTFIGSSPLNSSINGASSISGGHGATSSNTSISEAIPDKATLETFRAPRNAQRRQNSPTPGDGEAMFEPYRTTKDGYPVNNKLKKGKYATSIDDRGYLSGIYLRVLC